jgi:hypothetical protein
MIDFTTLPLHEPLPEVKTLNVVKNSLLDENKALRRTIRILVVGIAIIFAVQLYNKQEKADEYKEA